MTSLVVLPDDPRVSALQAGARQWWDFYEKRFVRATTVYIPYGCGDWGSPHGKRNSLCIFCDLPQAVTQYEQAFNDGQPIATDEHVVVFRHTLAAALAEESCHTVMIFNGGSFLAMDPKVQLSAVREVAKQPGVHRLVIESRAELITDAVIRPLTALLSERNIALTVRIGIETQDDQLRIKVLRKGHKRSELHQAVQTLHRNGVAAGGYALLNPAPGLEPGWAMEECLKTLDFVLGQGEGQLGMDECYFCSTNVGGRVLREAWQAGNFSPASLWMVYSVLKQGIEKHGTRIHLLPFADVPELVAVPSNHVQRGIPQDLSEAQGCDLAFHAMFEAYRTTMDPAVLVPPQCQCRPSWI